MRRFNNAHANSNSYSLALTTLCLVATLLSVAFPQQAAATQPAAADAPEATLDTPTPITTSYAASWDIHKGALYWSHHCPVIGLRAESAQSPQSPQAVNDISSLNRIPTSGGTNAVLTSDSNCSTFESITVDDSGVYYFDGTTSKIKVMLTNQATPVISDVANAFQVTFMALEGNFIYFGTTGQNIYRVSKTGGTPEVLIATDFYLSDFILSSTSIYWIDNSGLWWAPKNCDTLPCTKQRLSSSARGSNLAFGQFGEGGGNPASIVYVHLTPSGTNFTHTIRELNCTSTDVCQVTNYYSAQQNKNIGQFKFVSLPRSGPLPIIDRYLFWTERDSALLANPVGRLFRRIATATATQASEIATSDLTLDTQIDTNSTGIFFADGTGVKFLPFTASAIIRDLAVTNIEVTQGIQNLANSIGLVATKPTYVRVYGKQNSGPQAGGVELVLRGTRNGSPLPGSPLQPINGNVSLSPSFNFDRARLRDGWLFQLPSSWISQGNVVLQAELDPRHFFADSTPANNLLNQNVAFGREPNACLFFSPIRTDNPTPHVGDPNFWATMNRFTNLWPVPGVSVYSFSSRIEELQVCTWHGIPYPCYGPYEIDQAADFPSNWPSDKDRIIGKLMLRQAAARASTLPPTNYCQSGASVHSVGLVHPEADTTDSDGTLLGYANYYINAAFYKMEPFDSTPNFPTWYWPRAAAVLAQEVTHNFNRRHIPCGTNDDIDNSFPYPDPCMLNDGGQTNYYGFDVQNRTPIAPQIASDFMTYTPSRSRAPQWQGQWVSDYTYKAVKGKFGLLAEANAQKGNVIGPALPTAGEMVYAVGAVEPISNLGHLDYAYAQPLSLMSAQARSVWQEYAGARYQAGKSNGINASEAVTYHLRIKDPAGNILDDRVLNPSEPDMHDGDIPAWPFLVSFPAPTGTVASLELMSDTVVLDTLAMGVNPPTVSVVAPKSGDTVDNSLLIQWNGNDPDPQDVLHYNVEYSIDNGANWISVIEDYPGTPGPGVESLLVQDPLVLPGTSGATARVRITASDGYHSASAMSAAFTVAQRAPVAHITSPTADQSYGPNETVPLIGGATDAESGEITGTALSWSVDGTAAGTDENNSVRGLKPGSHNITLTATDPTSRTGNAQTTLHINPLIANDSGSSPLLDGLCNESTYDTIGQQVQLAPYADGSQATVRLLRNGSKLWVCFTGLDVGSNAQVGRASLEADLNFSQDNTVQSSDKIFAVGEDGGLMALNGDGSPADVGPLDARVTTAGSVWTAEMTIDASALGGFGHVIGARFSHNLINSGSDTVAWPYLATPTQPNTWGQTALGAWPTLDAISPVTATVGSSAVQITLDGSNFTTETVALLDGANLNTTFISATQLTAVIPAAQLVTAKNAKVQVVGAGLSSAPSPAAGLSFQVLNVKPSISSLTPDSAPQDQPNLEITVNGSNFAPGAVVLWEGQPLSTTIVSGSQVRASVSVAQLQSGRAVQVAVQNTTPGGGPSAPAIFLVKSTVFVQLPMVMR